MPHGHAPPTGPAVDIRAYQQGDAVHVRDLFVKAMREMVPDHLTPELDTYVAQAHLVELDRVEAYYAEHHGGFWVARRGIASSAWSASSGRATTPWSCAA